MKQTVFESIREQLVYNEEHKKPLMFTIKQTTPRYPSGVLKFLVNNKILKITDVKKSFKKCFEFTFTYEDLHKYNEFCASAFELLDYKLEKKLKDKQISQRTYREELECPNYSNVEDETGYMSCPKNSGGYEMIEPQDRCTTDFILSELGYDCYSDFVNDNEDVPIQELTTQMYEQLREFEKQKCARDWEIGEEEEIEI
jgi:hypothetical protein